MIARLACASALLAIVFPSSLAKNNNKIHSSTNLRLSAPPEQLRLMYTSVSTEMGIYWASSNVSTGDDYVATVQFGTDSEKLTSSAYGTNTNYTAFNIKSPSLHFAVMTGLTPSSSYFYRVGNDAYGWSSIFPFTSAPTVGDTSIYPISFITYGDMGISNSEHTANLTAKLIRSGDAHFILHTGDISYADDRISINNGSYYEPILNQFYNEVMISSAYAPYMMSSGNHESALEFEAYRMRVAPTLPKGAPNSSDFWYSFNFGPVHILAFDQDQDWEIGSPQHQFVLNDLSSVDRSVTPWVIAFNHFPLLCSNNFWCPEATRFRSVYDPIFNSVASRVDVHLAGHVHAAEILYPNINGTVTQTNFDAIDTCLQVMTGLPGDMEVCCNDWYKPQPEYSFWRDDDVASDGGYFGFAQFTIANLTHLNIRMWDAVNTTVVQDLWVSRVPPAERV